MCLFVCNVQDPDLKTLEAKCDSVVTLVPYIRPRPAGLSPPFYFFLCFAAITFSYIEMHSRNFRFLTLGGGRTKKSVKFDASQKRQMRCSKKSATKSMCFTFLFISSIVGQTYFHCARFQVNPHGNERTFKCKQITGIDSFRLEMNRDWLQTHTHTHTKDSRLWWKGKQVFLFLQRHLHVHYV